MTGEGAETVVLRPGAVSLTDCRRVRDGAPVGVDQDARPAVEAAADTVARLVARGDAVYGVNTGFGKLAQSRIDASDLATLQERLVRSHAAGVGDPLPAGVVRLILALKLASLGRGASGVRWEVLEAIQRLLEADCLPVIPDRGSVGASGDLAPLAHMTLVLMGEGEAVLDGERIPGDAALDRAGIPPLKLGPKEGLALLNGTQVSTALALDALFRAQDAFRGALLTGALSLDAARGSVAPFDPRIHELRGHRGQQDVAAALRRLMKGSEILASHAGCDRVQDAYCLRCQPQVMGAVLDLLRTVAGTLEMEANAVTDNPLVFPGTDEAISGGNFHAEPVAFAADQLALAICEIGSMAERRVALLTDPATSGLPAFLSPRPGLNSGFMMAHVTAAALVAENRQAATPASVDSIPTSANQEDHVSMATHAARRLGRMNDNLEQILAIELLCAAQGTDFHRPLASSPALEGLRGRLRREVPGWEDDRHMAPDIASAVRVLSREVRRDEVAWMPGVTGVRGAEEHIRNPTTEEQP